MYSYRFGAKPVDFILRSHRVCVAHNGCWGNLLLQVPRMRRRSQEADVQRGGACFPKANTLINDRIQDGALYTSQQIQFQNILRATGFEVKLKPFINRSDGSSKGDWDVGITIDILEYASKSDIIVLASGDGDFDILISRISKMYNNETEVYGVSSLTANSLKNITSTFFPISRKLLLS